MLLRMIGTMNPIPLVPEWLKESALIIISLGLLEVILWLFDRKELKEQTQLLQDILVTLSLREQEEPQYK